VHYRAILGAAVLLFALPLLGCGRQALIRVLQGQVDEKTAGFVNMVLGIE
jgi:hypothetical protein